MDFSPRLTPHGGASATETSKAAEKLIVIAYQHPRYQTGGESKRDHAVTRSEFDKDKDGRTLCGRPLGGWYFPRYDEWHGDGRSYECRICTKVARGAAGQAASAKGAE